ncbi:hypothetical protein [Amycolatopsis sp. MtRt-6]|nr:hypothetical protein [Amycolatopsis sp. MtRt-6]
MAAGVDFDRRHDLLFVAGAIGGKAYVYDVRTQAMIEIAMGPGALTGFLS